jgi:hypothetical protein
MWLSWFSLLIVNPVQDPRDRNGAMGAGADRESSDYLPPFREDNIWESNSFGKSRTGDQGTSLPHGPLGAAVCSVLCASVYPAGDFLTVLLRFLAFAGSVAEARASARASLASDSAGPDPSPRPTPRGQMPPLGKGARAGPGLKASSFVGWDPKGGPLVAGGGDGRRERARRAHSGHVL